MSTDKADHEKSTCTMDTSSTSNTSGHVGLAEDEEYVFTVHRLSENEDDTITEIPTLLVPKTIDELRGDADDDLDLEKQQPDAEEGWVEQPCLSPRMVVFLVIGVGIVCGAIYSVVRMRSNHLDLLDEFNGE